MNKLCLIFCLILFSSGVVAMSILDAGKVYTFSKMTGLIIKDGKPVKDALIRRTVDFQSKREDGTKTDENGRFELPLISERTVTKFLPQEFVVGQLVFVEYQGVEYKVWEGVKRSKEENSEAQGKALDVVCNLDAEEESTRFDRHYFISRCKWDVVQEELDTGF
jgi:Domain of unknown function (DUF6795)